MGDQGAGATLVAGFQHGKIWECAPSLLHGTVVQLLLPVAGDHPFLEEIQWGRVCLKGLHGFRISLRLVNPWWDIETLSQLSFLFTFSS